MTKRGGRRKKLNVAREPSGRIQRVTIGTESISILELEAITWKRRQRLRTDEHGNLRVDTNPDISPVEARKQEYGSVISAWLDKSNKAMKRNPGCPHPNAFTQMHYDTAQRFAEIRQRWLAAIDAGRVRSSSEFGGVGGHAPDPFIPSISQAEAKAIADFKAARRAILECGSPLGMMAIETIVIENQDAEDMRGDLRQALNSLARLWKLQAAA